MTMTENVESRKKMENSVCEECKLNPWKYKCPGCSIRSCGLACVKAHKTRTGCTGKRKLTEFVPLSKFDDNLLLSDYNMLEETKRVAESAQRKRIKLCKHPYLTSHRPFYLKKLYKEAVQRGTKLWFHHGGMLLREKNQTRYDKRSKCILWTIEWRFHSTDVVLSDHGVNENTNLCSVIENHLKPGPWIHKLKPFCDVDLDSLKFFIRQYPKGAKVPFKELDIKAPLRQPLAKVVILEYPVIHVYLPTQSYDFEVIRDFNHLNTTPNPDGSLYYGPGSINLREEKIEEEEEDDINSFEQMNNNPSCQRVSEGSKVEGGVSTENSCLQVDPLDDGNMEFEFDQELIDTYDDIFKEMNPGDFFNFECEFAEGFGSDDDDNNSNLQNLTTNELEEGEIVE